jgi:GT2 family glycosyltransferase/glycosyltransferase involved in cell wall biosynthesis
MIPTKDALAIISGSSLFDAEWYAHQYPDCVILRIPPHEHYLKYGAMFGRDPGPNFGTADYLRKHPEIVDAKINPLVHFETTKGSPGQETPPLVHSAGRVAMDVVVPVFNALEDVKLCLASIAQAPSEFQIRVIVVNDFSDAETTDWLRQSCTTLSTERVSYLLLEHEKNKGYTKAVNTGLRASDAPYIVTLNSDTIVTPYWVDGMVRCMNSAPDIGITGPLSNAASWQNVPDLYGPDKNFAINTIPGGLTPSGMAEIVRVASKRIYPRTTFVNGFCFLIKREVIDAVGYMDEEAFPVGYGEENDFCIRAQDAGFGLAYADDVYVFHAKSKSFGSERRKALSKEGSDNLRRKHTDKKFEALVAQVKDTKQMDEVRQHIADVLIKAEPENQRSIVEWTYTQKILFLLPVQGGSGGAHSVVQEVMAMRRLGVDAKIGVKSQNRSSFLAQYIDIPEAADIFIGFDDSSIIETAADFDVVIGTVFHSMLLVKKITQFHPHILPGYYIQDYEPLFFEKDSPHWQESWDSYTLIPGAVLFAKTAWICEQVETNHGVKMHKVLPSVDHTVYQPSQNRRPGQSGLNVAAMIRPATPRRGPGRTMDLLKRLSDLYGKEITVRIFGCDKDNPDFLALPRDFPFENHGVLTRPEVADILKNTDLFIDLSDYQAFGRTAVEAMACGCIAVVPQNGGANEFAIDGENALVVDTLDVDSCYSAITKILNDPAKVRRMQLAALSKAAEYSPRRAATSELVTFAPALADRRKDHPKVTRPRLSLIPSMTGGLASIAGSGYVRVVRPYQQEAIQSDYRVTVERSGLLPELGTADIVVLQRDLANQDQRPFAEWHSDFKAAGGRLVYEIDDDLLDVAGMQERDYKGDANLLAKRVLEYATAADVITVSTENLANVLSKFQHKIVLVPNYIDCDLWHCDGQHPKAKTSAPKKHDTQIRIGYVGTPTHLGDMQMISDAMKAVKTLYGDRIDIEVIGAFHKQTPLFGRATALPRDSSYPNFVDWLQQVVDWDICVIPLVDNSFNRSKSNLKFVECAMLDAAIVCSDNEEYRRVARDGENCLLVENETNAWFDAICRLVEDADLRARLARNARSKVARELTVQKNKQIYLSALGWA